MPNFYLSDDEIQSIVLVLLGQVSDKVPLIGMKNLNANEKFYEEGMRVANRYNCYGCHKIDGIGGKLSEAYEDQKTELNEKLKEVYEGLKSKGFELKTVKKILKLRKESLDKRREEQAILETYAQAIQFELF